MKRSQEQVLKKKSFLFTSNKLHVYNNVDKSLRKHHHSMKLKCEKGNTFQTEIFQLKKKQPDFC